MAKQPTPETIAAKLTGRERLALVVIGEGKQMVTRAFIVLSPRPELASAYPSLSVQPQ
jgi:hypothetical protein